ncbi:siderophore-interacting protein, partial [Pseudidiomarina aestuarii]
MPVKSDSPLIAKTRIVLSASADVANAVAAYYAEHDCDVTNDDNGAKISLSVGHLTLQPGEKHLDIEVGSKSEAGVAQMKAALIAIL